MPFDLDAWRDRLRSFPEITWEEYRAIPDDDVRLEIARRNKVISTDAYNRTMARIRGPRGLLPETFTLTFRRSSQPYLVANGIRRVI